MVRARSIDDVPVMALTLWTDDPQRGAAELAEVLNERFPYEYKSTPMLLAAGSRVSSDAPIDRELLTGVRMFARGYVAALERRRVNEP